VAERIGRALSDLLGEDLEHVEVAGPGFLNLFLSDHWHRRTLAEVLAADERFGTGGMASPERIVIEFVSANPTGPLVAASGRHAAYGDALARILEHRGHSVWREYYFNDAGNQIRLLGESVRARARGEDVPEGGYQGDYVRELAEELPGSADRDPDDLAEAAVDRMLEWIKETLERYGVHYDAYFSERRLHEGSPTAVERTLSVLEDAGHIYRSEGAVWLRTTTFGDDKDRVVIRSNGEPTYLAADAAYLQNKRERGFERQLMPVGSDHHAYVRELKAAMAALGGDPDTVEVPILQFVHLVHGEAVMAMSKRAGSFVMLDDLIDAIGVDATRFFMLRSSHDRTLELDLELAARQSAENPVYYVQYAHARIASLRRKASGEAVAAAIAPDADWGGAGLQSSERDLIKRIASFPEEVAEAAIRRAPHRIVAYSLDLARDFTSFYETCRVVGVEPRELEAFRLALSVATQRTIATALWLLGVSAPEEM
jgi:arginyl-tRNA synthetase